jgi:FKBP-type peptidyl-prolyl cis-trans isomerase FklB
MSEWTSTSSGLQYQIIESGEGASPGPTDTVSAHYHGTFEDGRVFDSSVERGEPIDLPVNGVIQGWVEALQMMKEGDKWRLRIPPSLGYGARGVGPIPGNTTLIFEIELIKVR